MDNPESQYMLSTCVLCKIKSVVSLERGKEESNFYIKNAQQFKNIFQILQLQPICPGREEDPYNFNCLKCYFLLNRILFTYTQFKDLESQLVDLKNKVSEIQNVQNGPISGHSQNSSPNLTQDEYTSVLASISGTSGFVGQESSSSLATSTINNENSQSSESPPSMVVTRARKRLPSLEDKAKIESALKKIKMEKDQHPRGPPKIKTGIKITAKKSSVSESKRKRSKKRFVLCTQTLRVRNKEKYAKVAKALNSTIENVTPPTPKNTKTKSKANTTTTTTSASSSADADSSIIENTNQNYTYEYPQISLIENDAEEDDDDVARTRFTLNEWEGSDLSRRELKVKINPISINFGDDLPLPDVKLMENESQLESDNQQFNTIIGTPNTDEYMNSINFQGSSQCQPSTSTSLIIPNPKATATNFLKSKKKKLSQLQLKKKPAAKAKSTSSLSPAKKLECFVCQKFFRDLWALNRHYTTSAHTENFTLLNNSQRQEAEARTVIQLQLQNQGNISINKNATKSPSPKKAPQLQVQVQPQPPQESEKSESSKKSPERPYFCAVCKLSFRDKWSSNRHLNSFSHKKKKIEAGPSSLDSTCDILINSNIKETRKKRTKIRCQLCKKNFKDSIKLTTHLISVHKYGDFGPNSPAVPISSPDVPENNTTSLPLPSSSVASASSTSSASATESTDNKFVPNMEKDPLLITENENKQNSTNFEIVDIGQRVDSFIANFVQNDCNFDPTVDNLDMNPRPHLIKTEPNANPGVKNEKFKCSDCSKGFKANWLLKRHLKRSGHMKNIDIIPISTAPIPTPSTSVISTITPLPSMEETFSISQIQISNHEQIPVQIVNANPTTTTLNMMMTNGPSTSSAASGSDSISVKKDKVKKVRKSSSKKEKTFSIDSFCRICDKYFPNVYNYRRHLNSLTHKSKLEEIAKNGNSHSNGPPKTLSAENLENINKIIQILPNDLELGQNQNVNANNVNVNNYPTNIPEHNFHQHQPQQLQQHGNVIENGINNGNEGEDEEEEGREEQGFNNSNNSIEGNSDDKNSYDVIEEIKNSFNFL